VLLLCFLLASCGDGEKTAEELIDEANAHYDAAQVYEKSRKDWPKAAESYLKAAELGHPRSQFSLSLMYAVGEGVPMDRVKAYMFSSLAATNPRSSQNDGKRHPDYFDNWKRMKEGMTKDQIAEGEKLTQEWLERKAKENGE
ncbi:hypothetical protein N8649_02160, partial [bacterium]|nr:hypothetical protein [bacterium]